MKCVIVFLLIFFSSLSLVIAGNANENLLNKKFVRESSGSSEGGYETLSNSPDNTKDNSPNNTEAKKNEPLKVPKLERLPVIDGKMDEGEWQSAAILKDFTQFFPGDNTPATYQTEVYIGYDAKTLYLAFHAFDDPTKVRATVGKRDDIFNADDSVRVLLDTFNDKRRSYVLIFNPLGVQQDGIRTEGVGADFSVDIVMESKGAITGDGYVVEVAIPFKSLRYEAGKGKLWGFHVFRQTRHLNNEGDSWMPIDRAKTTLLSQSGYLTGLDGIAAVRTLELIPSLTVAESGRSVRAFSPAQLAANPFLVDSGRFVNEPIKTEPSLTMKLGITPTVTLDATLNPDFAQIEADQTVITANQRFPIFYSEKRPFFLENIDIFQTAMTVVNTRAIIDPDIAVKLSGKVRRNSFGVIFASDAAPGNFSDEERLVPRNGQFLDKNALIGVLRYKRDIGKENSIGFFATSYDFPQRHGKLGGFDGRFVLDKSTTFTFQAVGTNSRRCFFNPEFEPALNAAQADSDRSICGSTYNQYRTGNSFGYFAQILRNTRNWNLNFAASGRTRDYRADVGFTERTDNNIVRAQWTYNSTPKQKGVFSSFSFSNLNRLQFDWEGRLQSLQIGGQAFFSFTKQSYIGLGADSFTERIYEEEFGLKRMPTRLAGGAFSGEPQRATSYPRIFFAAGSTPTKKISLEASLSYYIGKFDYDFGNDPRYARASPLGSVNPFAPLDPGPANGFDFFGDITLQPTHALKVSLDYTRSELTRQDTKLRAYTDDIFSINSTYQFSRFLFVRARADYDSLSSKLLGQALFGWNPSPGTSFYVGYNDNFNYRGYNPYSGIYEPGLLRNERTFFIKMSYLFRRSIG